MRHDNLVSDVSSVVKMSSKWCIPQSDLWHSEFYLYFQLTNRVTSAPIALGSWINNQLTTHDANKMDKGTIGEVDGWCCMNVLVSVDFWSIVNLFDNIFGWMGPNDCWLESSEDRHEKVREGRKESIQDSQYFFAFEVCSVILVSMEKSHWKTIVMVIRYTWVTCHKYVKWKRLEYKTKNQ